MTDALHRDREDSDLVTIDSNFVRKQAKTAFWQFFRPITVAFELRRGHIQGAEADHFEVPKSGRVEMRGYAIKKSARR